MSIKNCYKFCWTTYRNIRKRQSNNIPRQKISTFQWPARLDKKERRVIWCNLGAFDGAEVCEAVGNFLLYQLSKNYNKKDIGLYRDDGLAIFKNVSGSKAEKIKKVIFLMLRTDFFANPTMKSHKYIKNQTTHHPF